MSAMRRRGRTLGIRDGQAPHAGGSESELAPEQAELEPVTGTTALGSEHLWFVWPAAYPRLGLRNRMRLTDNPHLVSCHVRPPSQVHCMGPSPAAQPTSRRLARHIGNSPRSRRLPPGSIANSRVRHISGVPTASLPKGAGFDVSDCGVFVQGIR